MLRKLNQLDDPRNSISSETGRVFFFVVIIALGAQFDLWP